jgi:Ran GTPase-activating protein (RanGAP) involved in mRNA processing and transport
VVQVALDAAIALQGVERRLRAGESLVEAMTPPSPPEAAPKTLARAVRACGALGALNLSGAPLPVQRCRGADLSLCQKRLYDRDAVLLAELLGANTVLRSLALSQCRMSEAATLTIVGALTACRPSSLTELRLADNRLRVAGAHALLDALVQTPCAQLAVLDLSATEFCGGTMAEDCSFGALRGSAARIGDDGQVCRFDADGLCSAGPRMGRNTGCYHVEFEVLQATDADGAYVGIVRSDVNKSSYPGSDDKGLGWRAKGGVRHLHNTLDLGGAVPSWGQGDRVGVMLNTGTLEVSFVKNGKLLEQTCTAPMADGALHFAIGRYYGSYMARCVYVHQQGGDEQMDFSALERLCAFMTTPSHRLRELTIAGNHLVGLSRFHSGQRNEAGLGHLLDGLRSPECRLTHLDVSGNSLSHEDAAQLLGVALHEGSTVREMKVHQWRVPVTRLAADSALDLRAQQIEEADAMLLARLLCKSSTVTSIDLSDNMLTTPGAVALAEALTQSRAPLQALAVANNQLRGRAAVALVESLCALEPPTVQLLDLSKNPISDGADGAAAGTYDAEVFSRVGQLLCAEGGALHTLRLGHTQLCGDSDAGYAREGVVELAQALRRSTRLATLDLRGNHMRDEEAKQLADALQERRGRGELPSLTLDLSTNSLSAEALEPLRELTSLTAIFQKPLRLRTMVFLEKCVYGAVADAHALYLAHGGGPIVKISSSEWKEGPARFEGHGDDTNCVALHGDRHLLSGSDDYCVKLWERGVGGGDAGELSCVATLAGHEARVWCVVWGAR